MAITIEQMKAKLAKVKKPCERHLDCRLHSSNIEICMTKKGHDSPECPKKKVRRVGQEAGLSTD